MDAMLRLASISAATVLLALLPAGAAPDEEPPCRCALLDAPTGIFPVASTGSHELDSRIRAEREFLETIFQVTPEMWLLPASAKRAAFAARGSGQGTVALHSKILKDRFWELKHRSAAIAVVLAHQYAHFLQWKRGVRVPEKRRELHADFLAGYYLGKRNFATLGAGPSLDPDFAASLFAAADPILNDAAEHGSPDERVRALADGYRAARAGKLALDAACAKADELYPMPRIGYAEPEPGEAAPAAPSDPVEAYLSARFRKVKLPCSHRVACTHKVACAHPQPCTHKTACRHERPCVHRQPCRHKVECSHKVACIHRVACTHKTRCVHAIPCVHTEHECDYDAAGRPFPCVHTRHRCDWAHNFDYEHEWDFAHEFDREHKFDMQHEFDTAHPFDPEHDFDMAHEWDPQHAFDLAHEFDGAHDFDLRVYPKEPGE